MFRRIALFATILVLVAWGPKGHEVVGTIAQQLLNDDTEKAVKDLLGDVTLASVANWADDVRHTSQYAYSAPYHYADMPRGVDEFDLSRDCPAEGCVVQAINDYCAVLADTSKPKDKRAEALKFLVHFVGDIHQPLHAGYADDKGGNSISVRLFNKKTNLHSVWDSGLIDHQGKDADTLASDLLSKLNATKTAKWTAVLDPSDWATESHGLAVSHAYAHPNGSPVLANENLGTDYYDDGIDVVNEQLSKAGVRLAAILNHALSKPDTSTPIETAAFVGSKNSSAYHYPTCKIVKDIKPENLVKYQTAPSGKHLHKGCPW
jgi:hypothetical protein